MHCMWCWASECNPLSFWIQGANLLLETLKQALVYYYWCQLCKCNAYCTFVSVFIINKVLLICCWQRFTFHGHLQDQAVNKHTQEFVFLLVMLTQHLSPVLPRTCERNQTFATWVLYLQCGSGVWKVDVRSDQRHNVFRLQLNSWNIPGIVKPLDVRWMWYYRVHSTCLSLYMHWMWVAGGLLYH